MLAVLALALLAPLLICIAVAVKRSSPGPVLFRQRRVGRDGRPFLMLKFRTMTGDPAVDGEADAAWAAAPVGATPHAHAREVTPVGQRLRALGLDELAQLINVARGEMSLVGPRPERVDYVDRFALEIPGYERRHRVRPGITGWAQVNGLRGETSLAARIAHDNFYIDNWSPLLDVRILLRTPTAVAMAAMKALRPATEHDEGGLLLERPDAETRELSLARR